MWCTLPAISWQYRVPKELKNRWSFQLEPLLKAQIPTMKELRINSLQKGSVVANYDVILKSNVDGGNVEAVSAM